MATMPTTTARMISPRTSSTTAAPRMILASEVWSLPRSLSTRAVIPTLVAHNVAARKRRAGVSESGNSHIGDQQTESEGCDGAYNGNGQRPYSYLEHFVNARFESHHEEQDDDAEIRE